jgi:predicted nucleotidyltransferase
MNDVLGVVEARSTLPTLIDRVSSGECGPILIGSHRRARAAIVPLELLDRARTPRTTLGRARAAADLIVRLAAQSNLSAVAIFGSVARGESTESSDLDLLVDTTAETSLIDMARFERDMETLFEVPVDVIARSSLDPERDEAILREAIAL